MFTYPTSVHVRGHQESPHRLAPHTDRNSDMGSLGWWHRADKVLCAGWSPFLLYHSRGTQLPPGFSCLPLPESQWPPKMTLDIALWTPQLPSDPATSLPPIS